MVFLFSSSFVCFLLSNLCNSSCFLFFFSSRSFRYFEASIPFCFKKISNWRFFSCVSSIFLYNCSCSFCFSISDSACFCIYNSLLFLSSSIICKIFLYSSKAPLYSSCCLICSLASLLACTSWRDIFISKSLASCILLSLFSFSWFFLKMSASEYKLDI